MDLRDLFERRKKRKERKETTHDAPRCEKFQLPNGRTVYRLWRHAGPECSKQEGLELTEGGCLTSCCLLEEAFDPTKKEAVSQEVLAPPKLSPNNEELEIVNLSDDHNMELPISTNPLLTPPKKKELMALLKEYRNVFTWQYEEMPDIDPGMVAHTLSIEPGAKPVVQPRRIFHPDVEAQIFQEVKKLLAAGFIKPVKHPQ